MTRARWLLLPVFFLCAQGCAAKRDYSAFYAHPPRSIMVVPVVNETVEILAPDVLIESVSCPLGERGYYLFPIMLTDSLLRDMGLPEAGLIHQLPPRKFFDLFGADAVLLVTILDWGSQYIVVQNTRVIQARYVLIDTRTEDVLWDCTQRVEETSGGSGLLEMAISAAVDKLLAEAFESQYRLLAERLNRTAFGASGQGLPAGPYHSGHGLDRMDFPAGNSTDPQ